MKSFANWRHRRANELPATSDRWCVFCNNKIAAWLPFRNGLAGISAFLIRLETVGSNVERFLCPQCSSTDRERHLRLYLDRLNILNSIKGSSVLHMAPEGALGELIRSYDPSLYIRGDLHPADQSTQKINLEDIPFPEETFDMVIANHMLEHVDNPVAALREVHRVLKPGGRFVCQTPFASRLTRTLEDPLLQSENDRIFFYGQEDHVRLFGLDLEPLFARAGFVGRLVPHSEILPDVDPELLGVNDAEPFFDFIRG